MSAKYTGQCLCGEIRYSVDAEPLFAGNCHCRDCQRSSGSAFIPAMIFPEPAVQISGSARYFATQSDSGNTHSRGFCPHCGAQLFARFSNMPGLLGIKAGTLDDTTRYAPLLDFHVASAAVWDVMNPDVPKKQFGPSSESKLTENEKLVTREEAEALALGFLKMSKQFLVASERAGEVKVNEGAFEHATIPAIVCVAFAIELGLKAIYISEQQAKTKGHELKKLFNKLSSKLKDAIESTVPVPSYPHFDPPRTFLDVLKTHDKAFEKWRYACEGSENLTADITFLHKLAARVQTVAAGQLPNSSSGTSEK